MKGLTDDVGRMTDFEAINTIQESCYQLIDSVTALSTKRNDMGYFHYIGNKFYRMGLSAALKQLVSTQGGGGILDATSSVYYRFFQEWQKWLSAKSAD